LVERGRKRREVTGEAATPEAGDLGSGEGEDAAAAAAPKKRVRVRFAESGDEGGE
jgi:hypothetical protein